MKLEIACHSIASALAAQQGGADRIELCMALPTGGLTPGPGLLAFVRKRIEIPVHVLVRPRLGNFSYTTMEIDTMIETISHLKETGFTGVVVGCLDADYAIDLWNLDRLVEASGTMDITFHRAFDFITDKSQALEDLVERGIHRILTSGGAKSAIEGAPVIKSLVDQAADRLTIMPGAGITSQNITEVIAQTQATEYHASAKKEISTASESTFKLVEEEPPRFETSAEEVRRLTGILTLDSKN